MGSLLYIIKIDIALFQTLYYGIGTAAAPEFIENIGHVCFNGTQTYTEFF
jgi:hypothetical protein